jgi:hypothetical protein
MYSACLGNGLFVLYVHSYTRGIKAKLLYYLANKGIFISSLEEKEEEKKKVRCRFRFLGYLASPML